MKSRHDIPARLPNESAPLAVCDRRATPSRSSPRSFRHKVGTPSILERTKRYNQGNRWYDHVWSSCLRSWRDRSYSASVVRNGRRSLASFVGLLHVPLLVFLVILSLQLFRAIRTRRPDGPFRLVAVKCIDALGNETDRAHLWRIRWQFRKRWRVGGNVTVILSVLLVLLLTSFRRTPARNACPASDRVVHAPS